jgi:hypothetical protein
VFVLKIAQFVIKIFEWFIEEAFSQPLFTHKKMVFTTIGQTSKLLFTCRKSVYKEASKHGAFVTENVIDLQNKANQLTETEKMAICQHH